MTRPHDDSVQIALAELEALEADRQRQEQRAVAERAAAVAAELEARAAAETARQQQALRTAEREAAIARETARLDVDAVVEARTAESQRTVTAMRAELDRIQAERELLHQRMVTRAPEDPRATRPPSRHWPAVAGLFAATSSILGVLLFLSVTAPAPQPEVIIREVVVPMAAPEAGSGDPVAASAVLEPPAAEAPAEATPAPRRPALRPRPRPRDVLEAMDDCGDDPLCGL